MDTNVVSEVSKKRPSGKVLNFLQANETQCVVPSIVVAERYYGARTAPPDQRAAQLQAVRDFRDEFADRILPFDAEAAETWGNYVGQSMLRNKPRSYPDTQIAAIALTHNLTVVTRKHGRLPGVDTLNPFQD